MRAPGSRAAPSASPAEASRPRTRRRPSARSDRLRSSADRSIRSWVEGGEIGIRFTDDLDDPDDRRFGDARVVKEAEVADAHLLHVVAGLEVAHPAPFGPALTPQALPAICARFRFEQPMPHDRSFWEEELTSGEGMLR